MEEKETDETKQQETVSAASSENFPSPAPTTTSTSDGPPPPYEQVHLYAPIEERTRQVQNDNSTVLPSAHPAEHMYSPYPSPYNPAQGPPQGMHNFPMPVGPWGPPMGYPMQWPHANFGHPSSFRQPMQGKYVRAPEQPPTSHANQQFPLQPFPMQWAHANFGICPQNPPQLGQHPASETSPNSNVQQELTPTQSHPLESTTDEELTMKAHSSLHLCHDGPSVKQLAQQHEKPKAPPVKPKKKVNRLPKALLSKLEDEPIMVCVQDPCIQPRLAERIIAKCSCDTKVKPLTYILDLKGEKKRKKLDTIEKYTFGSKPQSSARESLDVCQCYRSRKEYAYKWHDQFYIWSALGRQVSFQNDCRECSYTGKQCNTEDHSLYTLPPRGFSDQFHAHHC